MKRMKMLLMATVLVFAYACGSDGLKVDIKALAANTELKAPEKSMKLLEAFTQILSKTASIEDNTEAAKYLNGVIDKHEGDIRKISEDFVTWSLSASKEELDAYTQDIEKQSYYPELDTVLGTLGQRMRDSEELQNSMMRFMQITNPEPAPGEYMPSDDMMEMDSVEMAPPSETPKP